MESIRCNPKRFSDVEIIIGQPNVNILIRKLSSRMCPSSLNQVFTSTEITELNLDLDVVRSFSNSTVVPSPIDCKIDDMKKEE